MISSGSKSRKATATAVKKAVKKAVAKAKPTATPELPAKKAVKKKAAAKKVAVKKTAAAKKSIKAAPAAVEIAPPPVKRKAAAKKRAVAGATVEQTMELFPTGLPGVAEALVAVAGPPASTAAPPARKKAAVKKKTAAREAAETPVAAPDTALPGAGHPVSMPLPKILELAGIRDASGHETEGPVLVPASGPVAADLAEIPPVPAFSEGIVLDFGEPVPAPPELTMPTPRGHRPPQQGPVQPAAPQAQPSQGQPPPARPQQQQQQPQGKVQRQSFPRDNRDNRDTRDNRDNQRRPGQRGQEEISIEADDEGEVEGRPGFRDRKRGNQRTQMGPPSECSGFLELSPKGFGFLRKKEMCFRQSTRDVFVLPDTVRHFGLREGMLIEGEACNGPRGPQLTDLFKVNSREPGILKGLPYFEELTAINPQKRFSLETAPDKFTTRVIDMMTPIGKGQRGLIVAPPRTGKTTLLHDIAEAISKNHEDVHLMLMLVDERPEEVTELSRALPNAEILASSNDNDVWAHLRVAEVGIQRAKRLVEEGRDVFILLDSITRLARAYNNAMTGKGRTMSGGVDARALEMPRRLFAAARNTREAGSLTIVGTALIETNSKADELIFQEFKGTGNMEIVLERKMAEQYVYPAVNIFKSGTRREELLLPPHQLKKIHLIRRGLAGHKPIEAMERLLHFYRMFTSNAQMLIEIKAKGY